MILRLCVGVGILAGSLPGFGQQRVTYHQEIAPLIQKHCVECHRKGGIGPFALTTYEEVARRSKFIKKVTESRYMPPFPADRSFQRYANERGLSDAEIALIQNWVEQGALEGKKTKPNQRKDPSEASTATSGEQLEWRMQAPYKITGNGKEDFRFFSIPTGLEKDVYVRAIEFIVGNRKIVHHSRLMTDTTRLLRGIDGLAETDPRVREYQKIPLEEEFLYGWVPGNDRVSFPAGTAKRIHKGTDLLLNMHYAPSPVDDTDWSGVRFYLVDSAEVKRDVKTLTLTENDISNQPFVLPAETRPAFYMSYGPTDADISVISVLPHMHQLGKTFRAFAITPGGDLVPFVKIDQWNFDWQMTYQFQKLLYVPRGSTILVEASYDNTSQNPENPFQPARDVTYGWNSTDEMMNLVIYYVAYQKGDEAMDQRR